MTSVTAFLFFSVSSLLFLVCTAVLASPAAITLPLTRLLHHPTRSNSLPQDTITNLATASTARAHHLKHLTPSSSTPLTPHSYGGYSITLQFGTPPQAMPLILDTGSDFVWFPCTHRYICQDCGSFPPPYHFIPKASSTAKILGCSNPKCGWIHHHTNLKSRCAPDCSSSSSSSSSSSTLRSSLSSMFSPDSNHKKCTQACPPYIILYGSGSTGGLALTETLHFHNGRFKSPHFLVGCSLFSSHLPSGIAGFGRGNASLPTQLRLTRFSYCLISHTFDVDNSTTTHKPGYLNLIPTGSYWDSTRKTAGVSYTPFLQNPPAFPTYYYVGLRKITVGGARVKLPNRLLLAPNPVGSGGTVVDSGTTLTYMTRRLFDPFSREFERQAKLMKNTYVRDHRVEELTGLGLCYNNLTSKGKGKGGQSTVVVFPAVRLQFKGGMKVDLPLQNYVGVVNGAACLMVVTDGVEEEEARSAAAAAAAGPAVILGNFQMQGFYVEFDLRNQRFGLKEEEDNSKCE